MTASPVTRYRQNEVTCMSAARRVVFLYSQVVAALRHASRAIQVNDHASRSQALCQGREIVNELLVTLDHEAGGDLAENLVRLYEYFQHEITHLDFHPDGGRLARLTELVAMLHDAWEQAARQVAEQPASGTVNG